MPADRHQRRRRKRQLLQLGEAATKHGIAATPAKEQVIGIALLMREVLSEPAAGRASSAAALMHKIFEASLKAYPSRMEIACKKGCGYCCHTWVAATAPELFLIARAVSSEQSSSPLVNRDFVRERAKRTAGLSVAERFGAKLPCALLVDNACSMYRVRPAICRQVTSASLEACLDEYDGRDFNGDVVASRVYLDHARNCRVPLQAALLSMDLPLQSYELTAGLSAALEPDAEASWLSRRDVFRDVAAAPPEPAPILQAIHAIAAELSEL